MTQSDIERLGAELAALEVRAGVADQVNDARLGPLMPDLSATSSEYFDDVEEYARRKVRSLYFGVQNSTLRKALIGKSRECDAAYASFVRADLSRARRELESAGRHAKSLPWLWAAIVSAACVGVGSLYFQLYGAIAGLLVGFFLGHAVIEQGRNAREDAIRLAQADMDNCIQAVDEQQLTPAWFNEIEEQSGERDRLFDNESVVLNRTKAKRSVPA